MNLHEMRGTLLAELTRLGILWHDGLERFGGPFLAGNRFAAVDAFFAPVAFRIQTCGLALDPASDTYATRLLDLDAMQNWYRDALLETLRDEPHDCEIM